MFKPKSAFKIILGTFFLAFILTACGNKSNDKKTDTTDTTSKMAPMKDTSAKMDTAGTRPVKEGN